MHLLHVYHLIRPFPEASGDDQAVNEVEVTLTSLNATFCVAIEIVQADDGLGTVGTFTVTLASNDIAAVLEPNKTRINLLDDEGKFVGCS